MHQRKKWLKSIMALVLACALLQFPVAVFAAAPGDGFSTLAGNCPVNVVNGAVSSGTPDMSQPVNLVIGLRLPDAAGLQSAAAAVKAHQMAPLTGQQFMQQYAPSSSSYQAVVSFLQDQGFQVTTSPNNLVVMAAGTLGQAAAAFNVTFRNYSVNGKNCYANTCNPQIPQNLAGIIQSVAGLDNITAFNTYSHKVTGRVTNTVAGSVYEDVYGNITPLGMQTAYNLHPVYSQLDNKGNKIDGTGQSIDIVIWNSLQQSDVAHFNNDNNLPQFNVSGEPALTEIPVGGTPVVDFVYGGSYETTLDVEMSHSMAPGANVNVYEAVSNEFPVVEEALNDAVVQHRSNVISMSWGASEDCLASAYLSTMDAIFGQATAEGITLLASSGDSGAYTDPMSITPCVSFPASDPYVTGVGGTTLSINSDGTYAGETTWNGSYGYGFGNGGGGGGYSFLYAAPAWQVPTVGSDRGVPDVSLNAGAGNSAYIDGSECGMLGTSISSPCWAGMVALIDQDLQSAGKAPLGSPNSTLYSLGQSASYGSVFHDVCVGNNDILNNAGTYDAGIGWDPVTGWGTPNFQELLNFVMANTSNFSPVLTASPAALLPGYPGGTVITVTGSNTNFLAGSTDVGLTINGTPYVSSVNVVNKTQLTFKLAAGLANGSYNIAIYDSTDHLMSVSLDVGTETAAVSPENLAVGYGSSTVNITGVHSYFQNGDTTAEVVYAADRTPAILLSPPDPAVDVDVYGYTSAAFTLPAGLSAGQYDVVVNDYYTGASTSAPLNVELPSSITVAANPASVVPNGSSASTITATVAGADGPLAGATVAFSSNLGTLASSTGVTNALGQVTDTITSTSAGTATVTATTANGKTGTASVTFALAASSGGGGGGGGGGAPPATSTSETTPPATSTNTSATASVGASGGVVATADNSLSLNIPAGAFTGTMQVSLSVIPTAQAYTAPGSFAPASPQWSIGTNGTEPVMPVPVTFHFDPASLGGLSPSRLGIYIYDPAVNTWSWVGGRVNTGNDTISANLSQFCIYSVLVNKAAFTDLNKEQWARPAVEALLGANIVNGTAPGIFDPDGTLTRAQFTAFLVNAEGLAHSKAKANTQFKDVDPSVWYAPYVAAAVKAGLVAGTGPDSFDPNAPITREEMAVMLSRLLGNASQAKSAMHFQDSPAIDIWAKDGVSKVVSSGLMVGFNDGTFQPSGLANRAQAAAVVAKYLSFAGKI